MIGESVGEIEPWFTPSAMRTNTQYITYYLNVAGLLVLGVIPFVLLAYYNYNIYKGLKVAPNLEQTSSVRSRRQLRRRSLEQESDFARVLIAIVITFILCHSMRIILNLYEMIAAPMLSECASAGKNGLARWAAIAKPFSKLMLIVNSSVNMIIYCCLNAAFRRQISSCYKHICKQFCCCSTVTDDVPAGINIEIQ